ncbi:MAG TPA: nuclear transport factor 2 family protein [Draconibacterium sp.]|jgi:ketosteroid isomerase-like protein|nr:nuclear transport factor 2 family protein [Draconibacterium sp.]
MTNWFHYINFLIILFSFSLFTFCKLPVKPDSEQLLETDRKFSATSVEKGFNIAFIEFAHHDAVLLRENSMPVVGKESVIKLFEKADTSGVQFTWEPLAGDIAKSGELGYTYGIYTFTKDTLTKNGTYVSIWKKDGAGDWKFVLDSGNEGIEKPLNETK